MNPYLIPGLEATPHAPLCPHSDRAHDKLYVPVDDTENQYGRFQGTMNSVSQLAEGGRLVIVAGGKGCGKTSLINRCATWLRDELAKPETQLKGVIFALTDCATLNQSVKLRTELVITNLVDHLRDERHEVNFQHIDKLSRSIREIQDIRDTQDSKDKELHVAKVDLAYKYLMSDALPIDRIAIILLPPSGDLTKDEIQNYAGLAKHPRIVFFVESDYVEDAGRVWSAMHNSGRKAPILLKVGLLNADDGWTYADARQGGCSADPSFPRVSKKTMQRVTQERVVSVGRLHRLLHGVYEDLAAQSTSLPLPEISYEHIADYYFRSNFSESGNVS